MLPQPLDQSQPGRPWHPVHLFRRLTNAPIGATLASVANVARHSVALAGFFVPAELLEERREVALGGFLMSPADMTLLFFVVLVGHGFPLGWSTRLLAQYITPEPGCQALLELLGCDKLFKGVGLDEFRFG